MSVLFIAIEKRHSPPDQLRFYLRIEIAFTIENDIGPGQIVSLLLKPLDQLVDSTYPASRYTSGNIPFRDIFRDDRTGRP